jgi:hypothetical protein
MRFEHGRVGRIDSNLFLDNAWNERRAGGAAPAGPWLVRKVVLMTRKILMGAFAAVLSIATGASAATISGGSSLFVAFNAGEGVNVDYLVGGARTNLPGGQSLVAPVIRNTISAGNQTYTLTGWHSGSQTTTANVYSTQTDGNIIASKGISANSVSGSWSRSTTFTVAEAPSTAKVSIVAQIPGSFSGILSGITSTP